MKLNELDKDEVILYEEENDKHEKLTLTNKKIIIEKPKKIFRKKQKINLENIRMYKDKVQIKQKKSRIIINNNVEYNCKNIINAKKITEQIITLKTGKNIVERTTDKTEKIIKPIKTALGLITLIKGAPIAIKEIKENGTKIIQVLTKRR